MSSGAGPPGMALSLQKEQQRVSAKLQQTSPLLVRCREQGAKAGIDDRHQLLGTDRAVTRQAFREMGEATDVGEDQASIELPMARIWHLRGPANSQARDVRLQSSGHQNPSSPGAAYHGCHPEGRATGLGEMYGRGRR